MKNYMKSKFSCQRDGLTIRGYEYRPEGTNLPVAIGHGFMANQMMVKHYAQHLARMGYASFGFDFNGGCVSALAAAMRKDEIKKLVLLYPAFCIPDDARSGKMMWAEFDLQNIPEVIHCGRTARKTQNCIDTINNTAARTKNPCRCQFIFLYS